MPPTEIYTFSLHDALPILQASVAVGAVKLGVAVHSIVALAPAEPMVGGVVSTTVITWRSEEHTSELQSHVNLVCRLLLEQKNTDVTSPKSFLVAPLQPPLA